jgi:predicted permease
MKALRRFLRRVAASTGGRQEDDRVREELGHHQALLIDEYTRAGMPHDEARRRARLTLGSPDAIVEAFRDQQRMRWMEDLIADVRYAIGSLLRTPGFAAVALVTLAVGIGLNAAIFSVVNAVLFRPLPFADSDRIVWLVSNVPGSVGQDHGSTRMTGNVVVADLLELRARAKTLSNIAVYIPQFKTLTNETRVAGRLEGWSVEPQVFHALGVQPLLGRLFQHGDVAAGGGAVVMLSHGTWLQHFGSDRDIVGKTVVLDDKVHQIVGVMPRGFEFPFELANRQFWTPLHLSTGADDVRVRLPMLAQLAPDTSLAEAEQEVGSLLGSLHKDGTTYALVRVRDQLAEPVRHALLVLITGVALVLLIACINVASLLLARSTARQREMAIRSALGAGRSRLLRQLLTESLVLGFIGACLGVVLAVVGIQALRALGTTLVRDDVGLLSSFPRLDEIGIDMTVLMYTLAAATVTGLLCGLLPGLSMSRAISLDALRDRMPPTFSVRGMTRRVSAGALLVVAEIALAMGVLIGGGLLVRSFVNLATVPLGYEPSHVLTFQVAMPGGRYKGPQIQLFAEDLVARLRQAPGITVAAYAPLLPMVNLLQHSAGFRRTAAERSDPTITEDLRGVSRDYFKVMGIRVLSGRGFSETDRAGQPRVVVISRSLARRDFPGEDPIGQMVYLQRQKEPWQVVGVIDDVRQVALREEPMPQVFVDARQWPGGMAPGFRFLQYYAVRTTGNPMQAIPYVADTVRQLDPQAAVYHIAPMQDLVSNSISRERLYAVAAAVFGAVALMLAACGVFGMMAYAVTHRTREIGIRIALGATRSGVLALLLRESLILTMIGIVLGLAGGAAISRSLGRLLFELARLDTATFVGMALMFVGSSALASYLPARQAAAVDPLIALRHE